MQMACANGVYMFGFTVSELNIWNDNIQSFRPETSEALVLVFHAVRTSVSVPRMQTVRGPYVSFSPLLGPFHGQYKFENK